MNPYYVYVHPDGKQFITTGSETLIHVHFMRLGTKINDLPICIGRWRHKGIHLRVRISWDERCEFVRNNMQLFECIYQFEKANAGCRMLRHKYPGSNAITTLVRQLFKFSDRTSDQDIFNGFWYCFTYCFHH